MDTKKEEKKKLTYEQLQAYASQMSDQANKLYRENQALRRSVTNSDRAFALEEIKCALECVKMKDSFSKEFIKKVVSRIEVILDPDTVNEENNGKSEHK